MSAALNIFSALDKYPLFCSYVFVDWFNNNAYLQWSNGNSINQIVNTMTELRRGIHSNQLLQKSYNDNSLKIRLLKEYDNEIPEIIMRIEAILAFQRLNALDMSGKYNDYTFKIETHVLRDFRMRGRRESVFGYPLVYVSLKSKGTGAVLLGIFENMMEAEEWIKGHYPGNIEQLILCNNRITKDYRKLHGHKLLTIKRIGPREGA